MSIKRFALALRPWKVKHNAGEVEREGKNVVHRDFHVELFLVDRLAKIQPYSLGSLLTKSFFDRHCLSETSRTFVNNRHKAVSRMKKKTRRGSLNPKVCIH